MKNYFKKKELAICIQNASMIAKYNILYTRHNHICGKWTLDCKPTPLSSSYKIEILYQLGHFPKVRVISPQLKLREGESKIPHMYGQERLCVFYPIAREWDATMLISSTIVPWSSLWLYYYEVWYFSGEWLGGGIEPNTKYDQ